MLAIMIIAAIISVLPLMLARMVHFLTAAALLITLTVLSVRCDDSDRENITQMRIKLDQAIERLDETAKRLEMTNQKLKQAVKNQIETEKTLTALVSRVSRFEEKSWLKQHCNIILLRLRNISKSCRNRWSQRLQ